MAMTTRQIYGLCLLAAAGCSLDQSGTAAIPVSTDGGPGGRGGGTPPPQSGAPPAVDAAPPDTRGPVPSPGVDGPIPASDAAPPAPAPPDAGPPPVAGSAFCPDDPELIFCARFEGAAIDESPSRLPVAGDAVRFVPGPSGQAAELAPGRNFSIAEDPRLDGDSITLQASVRPAALGQTMTVVENPGQYGLIILDSGSVLCGAGGSGQVVEPNAVEADAWTRLHCVLDGGTIRLWIDGQLAAQSDSAPLVRNRNYGLRIGWDDDPPRAYSGLIDDVRVWRAARPPAAD
jgi:hypothetical protein